VAVVHEEFKEEGGGEGFWVCKGGEVLEVGEGEDVEGGRGLAG